jgi:ribosome recycling factor
LIAESAADPKVKLQARAIANDCYKYIMDLTTNGIVVTDAIKYVQSKMDHLNNQEKKLLHDIREKAEAEVEEETATPIPPSTETATGTEEQPTLNGVF